MNFRVKLKNRWTRGGEGGTAYRTSRIYGVPSSGTFRCRGWHRPGNRSWERWRRAWAGCDCCEPTRCLDRSNRRRWYVWRQSARRWCRAGCRRPCRCYRWVWRRRARRDWAAWRQDRSDRSADPSPLSESARWTLRRTYRRRRCTPLPIKREKLHFRTESLTPYEVQFAILKF